MKLHKVIIPYLLGHSVSSIAKELGVSRRIVSKWIRGKGNEYPR